MVASVSASFVELVMIKSIMLVNSYSISWANKAHISRNVQFLGVVFDVKTDINNHTLSCLWFVSNQEWACEAINYTRFKFHNLFYLSVSKECFLLVRSFLVCLLWLNVSEAHERIMQFRSLLFRVKFNFNSASSLVNLFDFTNETIVVMKIKANCFLILFNIFSVWSETCLHVHIMTRWSLFHYEADWNHIKLLLVCFIEPRLRIKLNILKLTQRHKNVCSFFGAIDTLFNKVISDSVYQGLEFFRRSVLGSLLDFILVMIRITIQSINGVPIFEKYWESLVLVWEVNKQFFVSLISKTSNKCSKFIGAWFFHARGYLDKCAFKRDFLNNFGVVFDLLNTQVSETWQIGIRQNNIWEKLGLERLLSNVAIFLMNGYLWVVSIKATKGS